MLVHILGALQKLGERDLRSKAKKFPAPAVQFPSESRSLIQSTQDKVSPRTTSAKCDNGKKVTTPNWKTSTAVSSDLMTKI